LFLRNNRPIFKIFCAEAKVKIITSDISHIKQPVSILNPLNVDLNPICHLLALLGGATIVVVSRLRVKLIHNMSVSVMAKIRSG